jgi:hypothetical protein
VNSTPSDGRTAARSPAVVEIPVFPDEAKVARGSLSGGLSPDPAALRVLPAEFARRHRVLPLGIRQGMLRLAVAEPAGDRLIEDIRLLTGLEIEEVLVPAGDILERIGEGYRVTVEQMIENLEGGREAVRGARQPARHRGDGQ